MTAQNNPSTHPQLGKWIRDYHYNYLYVIGFVVGIAFSVAVFPSLVVSGIVAELMCSKFIVLTSGLTFGAIIIISALWWFARPYLMAKPIQVFKDGLVLTRPNGDMFTFLWTELAFDMRPRLWSPHVVIKSNPTRVFTYDFLLWDIEGLIETIAQAQAEIQLWHYQIGRLRVSFQATRRLYGLIFGWPFVLSGVGAVGVSIYGAVAFGCVEGIWLGLFGGSLMYLGRANIMTSKDPINRIKLDSQGMELTRESGTQHIDWDDITHHVGMASKSFRLKNGTYVELPTWQFHDAKYLQFLLDRLIYTHWLNKAVSQIESGEPFAFELFSVSKQGLFNDTESLSWEDYRHRIEHNIDLPDWLKWHEILDYGWITEEVINYFAFPENFAKENALS